MSEQLNVTLVQAASLGNGTRPTGCVLGAVVVAADQTLVDLLNAARRFDPDLPAELIPADGVAECELRCALGNPTLVQIGEPPEAVEVDEEAADDDESPDESTGSNDAVRELAVDDLDSVNQRVSELLKAAALTTVGELLDYDESTNLESINGISPSTREEILGEIAGLLQELEEEPA